jgi:hypothetical protein
LPFDPSIEVIATMEGLFGTSYPDLELARAAVDEAAQGLGICLNVRKHERNKAGFYHSTVLSCNKGRKYTSQASNETAASKHRETATGKTDCPYCI